MATTTLDQERRRNYVLNALLDPDDGGCPVCGGPVEVMSGDAITCWEHGSEHFRVGDQR